MKAVSQIDALDFTWGKRRFRNFVRVTSAVVGLSSCIPDAADAARARAAHDYQCPPEKVRVKWLRTTDVGEAYEVYACGDTAKYICDDGCERADVQHTLSIRSTENVASTPKRQSHVPVTAPAPLPLGDVGDWSDLPVHSGRRGMTANTYGGSSSDSLLLFGGDGHRTFLGCLNCSEFDSASVHNKFGDYGSKFSDKSVFNAFGDYGSPYSQFSACNPMADDPPVVVDHDGHVHGRLTLNRSLEPPDVPMIAAWLAGICER